MLILPAGHAADHYDRRRILAASYVLLASARSPCSRSPRGRERRGPIFAVMTLFGVARAFASPPARRWCPTWCRSSSSPERRQSTRPYSRLHDRRSGAGRRALPRRCRGRLRRRPSARPWRRAHTRLRRWTAGASASRDMELAAVGPDVRSLEPVVLGSISLDLFAVLFGGATALLPIYARDILDVGPVGLGVLRAAPGIGAALSALSSPSAAPPSRRQLDVRRRGRVRRRDGRVRSVDELLARWSR